MGRRKGLRTAAYLSRYAPGLSSVARSTLAAFGRCRHGGVAIIFGLALVPLALAVGGALDYSRASDARTRMLSAVDEAAISAVSEAAMKLSPAAAEKVAQKILDDRIGQERVATRLAGIVTVVQTGARRTVTVTFTGDVPTTLFQVAGLPTLAISGDAKASRSVPYVDFHLLLDNSPSMGLGGTQGDIDKMVAATGCAFACHDMSKDGKDAYATAKKLGVDMRIDVVRQASQKLMDNAKATAVIAGQYRAAIYTLGKTCGPLNTATEIAALSDNMMGVKSAAGAIDLMEIAYQNFYSDQCTNLSAALGLLNAQIAAAGDGSSPSSTQKVVFLVSDGVQDYFNPLTCAKPTTSGRCQEPISQGACTTLKDRGVKIAVLYTTYLPLPTDGWYNKWIKPFRNDLSGEMQACASPGLFFEVSPTEGIADAMVALFDRVAAQARLTE